ncbi:hypothetical protein Glove_319g162 [Diversispora epigaea]|uniref:CCD97-like C-terminal domain-containing protein n=1 Tax=Diversispora epigaea TaxID=1348612 RepID=A0A397HQ18_9GLOM|nr:hypothetical protein Glove_319g162 [Diversispora epigaea]
MDAESKKELLHFIKENISTIHFKTLRENEIEKSDDIKLAYMKHTLDDDPALFLSKWGKDLPPDQLSKFERLRNDYEINWHLNQLQNFTPKVPPPVSRNLTPNARHNKQILNRRYRYLITKLDSTSYFNDEAIESREPLLYENYVGQYLPEEERHPPFPDNVNLVDRVLYDIDQNYIHEKKEEERKLQEEQFEEEEEEEEEEGEEEEEEIEVNGLNGLQIDMNNSKKIDIKSMEIVYEKSDSVTQELTTMMSEKEINNEKDEKIQISDEEKEQLRADLIDIMREKFLSGNDPDFDYDTVDFNEEFDDVETEEQDIQDKYFDNEPDDMEEENTGTGILDY